MLRRAALAANLALALSALAGCGDEHQTPIDASIAADARTDAATVDAATDAATVDAATDAAAVDAATDAPIDGAATDAPIDGAATDAPTDAAATDAAIDGAATDAPTDAASAPTASLVIPDDGLATVTTAVAFTGENLTIGTTVTFAGVAGTGCTYQPPTAMVCQAPPAPAGRGPIVLSNPGGTTQLATAWTYTGVRNETDQPAEADYCNLQFPSTITAAAGALTPLIYGRLFENGLTQPAGEPTGVTAEVGLGPAGTNPTTQAGWQFAAATYNLQVGNDDEYMGTLRAPASAGTYAYAFRFSFDGGLTWTYGDLDGAGANATLDFSASQLGVLTVTP